MHARVEVVLPFLNPECDGVQDSLETQVEIGSELPGQVRVGDPSGN